MPHPADGEPPLVYVSDASPGWTRRRRGAGFVYRDADGAPIRDASQLDRIRRLAIPPAYEQVWICPLPHGHLQATGRDARGRKQYRYHARWHEQQGQTKFERLRAFGAALPALRAQVRRDLEVPGLAREKVLAALVRLLDTTYLRVGNDEYARDNGSFGLTTLRRRHVAVRGKALVLSFRGKSGVQQQVEVDDPQLSRIVRRCQDLPGQDLFKYLDELGTPRGVGSADVNEYLRACLGDDFSAKDFRTWHASALALDSLLRCASPESARDAKRQILDVIAEVASQLGHTVAVCRKSYIHQAVLSSYSGGSLAVVCGAGQVQGPSGLKAREKRLLALLAVEAPSSLVGRVRAAGSATVVA